MHLIAGLFADLSADILAYAENVSRRAHPHQTALVKDTVKLGGNRGAAAAEFSPHIPGKFNICPVQPFNLPDYGIKFIDFWILFHVLP